MTATRTIGMLVLVTLLCSLNVFAAEQDLIPAELKGFRGMMSGTLLKKGDTTLDFNVGKVTKVWRQNRAEHPERAVGQTITLSLGEVSAHHKKRR